MHQTFHEPFLQSIHGKLQLTVCFESNDKGRIIRTCIPFDFGPSNRYKDDEPRYHFYDLDSPDGKHNLSIKTSQLFSLEIRQEAFDPKDFVTWPEIKWHIQRDWGIYS
jgi:hypothetical protein